MSDLRRRALAIFLTNGRGFSDWVAVGSLSREVALYRRFAASGWPVTFYSYDRTRYAPRLDFPAEVRTQWPYTLPRRLDPLYWAALPLLRFPSAAKRPTVVLTNQAHSGWPAIGAAKLWGAKLVARCGYVYGEREEAAGHTGLHVKRRMLQERSVFRHADRCVVPTAELAAWICENYDIDPGRIVVIPNNVDTEAFRPLALPAEVDVICVGRLTEKKRHHVLLQALAGSGASVRIVGSGAWRDRLLRLATECDVALDLIPSVPNADLPRLLGAARLYVNLSRWEGHPKALIEAMACGRACVGADSPGIRNLLEHRRTGWLVRAEAGEIRNVITTLLADENRRTELGAAARAHALEALSLDRVHRRTHELLEELRAER